MKHGLLVKHIARFSMATAEHMWITDYSFEIHEHLRLKEQNRPVFGEQSPQLHARSYIVTWISNICRKLNISRVVQHMTIYFLDFFMDNHSIEPEELQLVALGCLLVAAKLEEKDDLIPKSRTLNCFTGNIYIPHDFLLMELQLLKFFQCDLLMPTSAHFMDYYTLYAISPTDKFLNKEIQSFETAKQLTKKYAGYFLDITLHDHRFLKFAPSLVAASCIAATRICLNLSPIWPASLQKLTMYSMEQLNPCLTLMLRILEAEEKMTKQEIHKTI